MFSNFNDACKFLAEELNWNLGDYPFEDLTFSYAADELGVRNPDSSGIRSIHQLRPMSGGVPWAVFFIDFETRKLQVSRMRDVLSALIARKRASTNQAQRAVFPLGDLLFITRFGTKREPGCALLRFHDDKDRALPVIHSIEWTERDPSPRLKRIHRILVEYLSWPEDTKNHTAWRKQWANTFEQEIETPEVSKQIHEYYVQKHLRSTPQNTPLKPEEYTALFKHIKEANDTIKALDHGSEETFLQIKKLIVDVEILKNVIAASSQKRVEEIANRIFTCDMEKEDLAQEGNLGLRKAIDSFDFHQCDDFLNSVLTFRLIENAIIKAIEEKDRMIYIPKDELERAQRIREFQKELRDQLGRSPTPQELAKEYYLPIEHIKKAIAIWKLESVELLPRKEMINQMSLDTTVSGFEIQDPQIDLVSLHEKLEQALGSLTDLERGVLALRFGLNDEKCRTMDEVGRRFEISADQVKQIEAKALRKMRHPTRIRQVEGFINLS